MLAVIPAVVTPAIINQVDSMDIEVQRIVDGISDFMSKTTIMGYTIFQGIQENLESSVSQILHPGQLFESAGVGAVMTATMVTPDNVRVNLRRKRKEICDNSSGVAEVAIMESLITFTKPKPPRWQFLYFSQFLS